MTRRHVPSRRLSTLLALATCLLWAPVEASSVLPLDLGQLCDDAVRIQHVRVVAREVGWGEHLGRKAIVTRLRFEVLEAIAGEPVDALTVYGGELEGERAELVGQPDLQLGEEALLFLHGKETQSPYLGLYQGVFRFRPEGTYRRLNEPSEPVLDVTLTGALRFAQDNELPLTREAFLEDVRRLRELSLLRAGGRLADRAALGDADPAAAEGGS